MEWSEGYTSMKNPVTPPGIDPETVRLVAQRLKHYVIPGPYSTTVVDANSSLWSNFPQKNNRFDSVFPTPETSELDQIQAKPGRYPVVTQNGHPKFNPISFTTVHLYPNYHS